MNELENSWQFVPIPPSELVGIPDLLVIPSLSELKVASVYRKSLDISKTWLAIVAIIGLVIGVTAAAGAAQAEPSTEPSAPSAVSPDTYGEEGDAVASDSDSQESDSETGSDSQSGGDEVETITVTEEAEGDDAVAEDEGAAVADSEEDEADESEGDSNLVEELLTGKSRSKRSVSNAKNADPRYQCGLSIGVLFDASRSTSGYKTEMQTALMNVLNSMKNSGSSIGIHTFEKTSPSNPRFGNLDPVLLDDAGYKKAKSYVDNIEQAWGNNFSDGGTNIAGGLKTMNGKGYDVVILITDGIAYQADRTRGQGANNTTEEDLYNTINAASNLDARLMSIYVDSSSNSKARDGVYNSDLAHLGAYNPRWQPSNRELPPGVYVEPPQVLFR